MENFKEKAVDTYLESVKAKLPGIPKIYLDWFETAFKAGYNIGKVDEHEVLHQIALDQLSK
ncbi:hypothetical protein D3C84_1066800 [compost metagenome]